MTEERMALPALRGNADEPAAPSDDEDFPRRSQRWLVQQLMDTEVGTQDPSRPLRAHRSALHPAQRHPHPTMEYPGRHAKTSGAQAARGPLLRPFP